MPAFTPQPQSITALWLVLIYRPTEGRRLSRPGWLVTYRNKVPPPGVEPGHVTHPSTNRARRRVTSLIRTTPLPLRHAATQYSRLIWFEQFPRMAYNSYKVYWILVAKGNKYVRPRNTRTVMYARWPGRVLPPGESR